MSAATSTVRRDTVLFLGTGCGVSPDLDAVLRGDGVDVAILRIEQAEDYRAALERRGFDVIVAGDDVPGLSGAKARELAWQRCPDVPVVLLVSGATGDKRAEAKLAGAVDLVDSLNRDHLAAAVGCALGQSKMTVRLRRRACLVRAIQDLSLVRTLEEIQVVVRRAARELTGADGATFVLRDNGCCFYADEDAISPLWKGKRFPMSVCISGWTMLNRQPVAIEDIYADSRIPADAYRPTFVQSLLMVPIRTEAPIGAIGNYWASSHRATAEETELLQALANTTSVAMENVRVYQELEQRVRDRTVQLEATNRELESFSYSVSHDLRSPLTIVKGYAEMLLATQAEDAKPEVRLYLERLVSGSKHMCAIVDDLLRLAMVARSELRLCDVDLGLEADSILSARAAAEPARNVDVHIEPGLVARADPGLMRVVLENLLSNAWKYTAKTSSARIEMGAHAQSDGRRAFVVRDNGAGFDMAKAGALFSPFQRLHSDAEVAGTGVGLATVQRVIHRHGGRIWAEAAPGKGAAFFFTIP